MPLIKKLLTLLPFLLVQIFANAQEKSTQTTPLSLKQAQEYAVLNNANAKNASIDLELAKKKIWETTAIGLPQVNAQVNYQHLFKVPELSLGGTTFLTTNLPDGTPITATDILNENVYLGFSPSAPIQLGVKDNTTLDITLTQLVFSGEYLVGLQASKVFYLMSDQSQQKTIIDLKESVSNTYSLVLVLEQSQNTLAQSLENLNKTLGEMREMYKQGFIENTDVDQIELTTLNITNSLNSIKRQADASRDLLKFQLGLPFDNQITLTDNLESIAGEVTLETALSSKFILNQNINYQILETQEKLGVLSLKREKSGYLPSLAAVYRHSEKVNQPAFDFTPKDVIQLSLSIPVFSSGQRLVKVQQRKLELQKVVNTKENVASGLQLEYTNAKNEMATAFESYLNNKKNIDLTNRIYEKTLVKYKEGLSSSMDLTNAQNQYLTAQGDYYNAVYKLITVKNKLDKLTNNL
ncbi:MAG: TolC family protein [Lentimicrobiaceae bacterium]|nr:TolC family protein [Lentimicrobiaceae bacterium]MCO5266835.1 TolC family protein [Lentimicrobium sp.]